LIRLVNCRFSYRAELAPELGAGDPVLRLSRGRPADHLLGHFPTDDAATKLLFFVLRQAAGEWKMPPREWFEAKTQFAIMFDERFVQA
jgi:hypothetical protein